MRRLALFFVPSGQNQKNKKIGFREKKTAFFSTVP